MGCQHSGRENNVFKPCCGSGSKLDPYSLFRNFVDQDPEYGGTVRIHTGENRINKRQKCKVEDPAD